MGGDIDPGALFGAYVTTYIERDIRQITRVQDLNLFQRLVALHAARCSKL